MFVVWETKKPASPSVGSVNLAGQAVFTVELRLKKKEEWSKVKQTEGLPRWTPLLLRLHGCPSQQPPAQEAKPEV